ncbi:TetR/AcrR family transcriptional regulator [Paraferrimonas sedimenticola]|uniref:TetR family transcriptional regulator n=1 Tax=Paraferrimonas sedimenticola TaxID=375674 RepID=A0AA37VTP7_9GAMM|nr:TetR/AcrR family transcriptional regulator [Paraferrimonas sedimenticola]GLP95484.1 TetR family transcriptional regulator [Paraferrimonas sedimenticola]
MEPKKRDTSRKRNSILDAAIHAFQQKGFDNTSMDYVAEVAGASKRTVYNHFPSKEALFQAMMDRCLDEMRQLKQIGYDSEAELAPQLKEFAVAKAAATRDPQMMGVMKIAMGVLISQPDVAQTTMQKIATMENTLALWLDAAIADNRIVACDTQTASDLFYGMVSGNLFWPALLSGALSDDHCDRLADELVAMFLQKYQA